MKNCAVVVTTINKPSFLYDYQEQAQRYGVPVDFIVVPDNKTPDSAYDMVEDIKGEMCGTSIFGIENDDGKRVEGILAAMDKKVEYVILLDDDNFQDDSNVFEKFDRVGDEEVYKTYSSPNQWVNNCLALTFAYTTVFPRGFPISRHRGVIHTKTDQKTRPVVVAGLWKATPDIDAIFHIANNPTSHGLIEEFVLGKDQFCPFNSQNTAILTRTLPAYYYPPRFNNGFKVGRFGDIFAGLFYEKVMHHMNEGTVLFGDPVSRHERNAHNYLGDLEWELMGMIILEDILEVFEQLELSSDTWGGSLIQLLESLLKHTFKRPETAVFLQWYLDGARKWVEECAKRGYV